MVLGFFFQDESNEPKITIQLVWEVLKLELQKLKITTITVFVYVFSLVTSAFARLTVSWVRRYFLAKFNRVGMTNSKEFKSFSR